MQLLGDGTPTLFIGKKITHFCWPDEEKVCSVLQSFTTENSDDRWRPDCKYLDTLITASERHVSHSWDICPQNWHRSPDSSVTTTAWQMPQTAMLITPSITSVPSISSATRTRRGNELNERKLALIFAAWQRNGINEQMPVCTYWKVIWSNYDAIWITTDSKDMAGLNQTVLESSV